jgi:hypothetical protein
MGKKRNRSKYTSKGVHSSVSKSLTGLISKERSSGDRLMFKIDAWEKNLNPWLSIDTGAIGSNKRFIRVRANEHWGKPQGSLFILKPEKAEKGAVA